MSTAARTATAEQRSAIYASLTLRNRLVSVLRIGLPIIAAILTVGLLAQLYIGSLAPGFGFAKITIDRNNLRVETPAYSGVATDGTVYSVGADTAKAALGNTDLIDFSGARLSLKQPSGASYGAQADSAQLRISDQVVSVDGPAVVEGSNGMVGTITDPMVEVESEQMKSSGPVDFTFPGGTRLKADSMTFDNKALRFQFSRVTLLLSGTPNEVIPSGLRPGTGVAAPAVAP